MNFRKQDSTICCLQETYFKYNDNDNLNMTEWKNICQENAKCKKAVMTIFISARYRIKNITSTTERHFIMNKRIIHHEDSMILNMYAP